MEQVSEYLTWKAPDGSRVVRLARPFMTRIGIEIMRGFGVTRRRGTESGGLLLGRIENDSVIVEDFEAVPCEYAFGPSYILSPADQERFGEAVAKLVSGEQQDRKPVGYWRSHTREGLAIEKADADLFEKYLQKSGHIALLLKPYATKPPVGSFFFPEHGRLIPGPSVQEFAFVSTLDEIKPAAAEPVKPPPAPEPPPAEAVPFKEPELPPLAPVAPVRRRTAEQRILTGVLGPSIDVEPVSTAALDELAFAVPLPRSRPWLSFAAGLLFTAAALTLGLVAGYQLAGGRVAVFPAPALDRPDALSALNLGMRVDKDGERVRLRWSPDSPAARSAVAGRIVIQDAGANREQPLEPAEFRGGIVLYRPAGAEVRFRLELTLASGRSVSETAIWPPAP